MVLPTSLRELMAECPGRGTFLKIPRFEIVDVPALSGFDFMVCDYEHSQTSVGEAWGVPVLVRVPLARGSRAAARELRKLVSYPPLGTPSVSLAEPAANCALRDGR